MITSFSYRLVLVLLLLVFANVAQAQTIVSPDSCLERLWCEKFDTLSVGKGMPSFCIHSVFRDCYRIDIVQCASGDTVQRIRGGLASPVLGKDKAITFPDANFDGFRDIKVFYNHGNATNEAFDFWLFDPQSGLFRFNEEFTEKFGCNSIIREDRKQIEIGGSSGCLGECWSWETYGLVKGKLTLIRRESQEWEPSSRDSGQPIFVRKLEQWKSGRLSVVRQLRGTLRQIAAKWH